MENFTCYILEVLPESSKPDLSKSNEVAETKAFMLNLIKLEQNYIDLFINKYNINPAAVGRLGAKHTEETKALLSKHRKANPSFLNKTHSSDVIELLRNRMTGSSNPMYGKPFTEENKKLIS